jgi:hypothetical protein
MAISSQKLLGTTDKGGGIVLAKKSSASAIVKKSPLKSLNLKQKTIKLRNQKSKESFNFDKLIPNLKAIDKSVKFIDKAFKKIIGTNSKILSEKDKQSKVKRRKVREDDLEKQTKKEEKGGKGSGISIPKPSFLDKILNFFFWTIAGNLFFKFFTKENIDKANNVFQTIISIGKFIGTVFVKTVEGLVNFIDFSYEKFDQIRGFIKKVGGEGALKIFDQFSGMLNKVINGAIILAILLSKSKGFGGRGGRGGGGRGGRGGRGGGGGDVGITGRRAGRTRAVDPAAARKYAERYGRDAAIKKFGKDGVKSLGGKYGRSAATNLARKGAVSLLGKGGTKAALKIVRPFVKRLPLIGGLIDFGLSVAMGEPLGRAAFKGIGAAILGTIGTGFGGPIGAVLGGFAGDWAGGKLYDIFFGNKKNNAGTQGRVYGGLIAAHANGGNVVGKGGRTLKKDDDQTAKLQKRKNIKAPQKVEVGKDVGGINKVQELFPKSPDQNKKSPFDALLSLSYTLKKIPFIGRIMGAAIDLALGQSITTGFFKEVSDSLVNLYQVLKGSNTINRLYSDVSRDITKMEEGGEIKNVSAGRYLKIDQNKGVTTEDMRNAIENSLRQSTSRDVTKAVNVIRRQLGLKEIGEPTPKDGDPQGKEDDSASLGIDGAPGEGGTVTGGNADFWTLVAIARMEDSDPQGSADVAQSIYNRVASGIYGGKTIKETVLRQGQYEPTWKYPKRGRTGIPNPEWHNIKDLDTASAATGISKGDLQRTAAALKNSKYQEEARKFVGGRTDFMGGGNKKGAEDVQRTTNTPNNFFGWFVGPAAKAYGAKNPGAAKAPQLGDITVMGGVAGSGGKTAAGGKTVVEIGKSLLKQGFKVAEHPDFTKHVGYTPGKGSVSGVHKGRGHYEGRALDVTDFRGSLEDSKARYRSVLNSLHENRKAQNINMLIHDSWGAMYGAGAPKEGAGGHGHPTHMHIETTGKQGGGPIQTPTKDATKYNSLQKYQSYGGGSSVLAVRTVYIKT